MRIRPSIGVKVALAFLLIVLTAQWVGFTTNRDAIQTLVDEREIDKVRTAGRVVDALLARELKRLTLVAQLLGMKRSVAEAVLSQSGERHAKLRATLAGPYASAQIDALAVVDSGEEIAFAMGKNPGKSTSMWGVAEALEGRGLVASAMQGDRVVVSAIEPIRSAGRVVGAIIVGGDVGSTFIETLGREIGAETALVSRAGKAIAAYGNSANQIDSGAVSEALFQKIPVYRKDPGARATVAYIPVLIVDDAYVVIVRADSSAAYRVLTDSVTRALVFALMIVLASITAAALIMRRLLRPLQRLRGRAERTAVEITGRPLPESAGDEVGSAVQALETLTDRLLVRNRELAEAKAAADAASEAKSRFLSNMSHEIRTPLNGVLGMAELLQETPLDANQARYCRTIVGSGLTLRDLLGDILDLAKIESGEIVLETIDFDPETLVGTTVEVFRELASKRGSILNHHFGAGAKGRVSGDPTRLRQVLTNLLGNAIKFTEHGEIDLSVTVLPPRSGDERKWLRFSVRDTGPGIAPEVVGTLFRPFVQADPSTTRNFGGTGLGLAISRHLVELMGGKISLESTPGQGATFWFDVPMHPARPAPELPPQATTAPEPVPVRVLVVEDNPVNQEVIGAQLARIGATVTLVDNGLRAVEATRHERFDIVLMDCQMPVMDGYQAAAEIRAIEAPGERVPIVALTANAFADDRRRCLAAGMDDYLPKPVSSANLVAALRRWTRRDAVGPDLARVSASSADTPPAAAAVDEVALATLVDGIGTAAVARIMRLYLDTADKIGADLELHAGRRDLAGLASALHPLTSSSANLGGAALAETAAALERLSRAGDVAVFARIPELRTRLDRFCEAISRHPILDRTPVRES